MNLVLNARDAMSRGEHGTLTIATDNEQIESAASEALNVTPGRYVDALGTRHRKRHEREHHSAHLRAVLHHQGEG